MKKNFCGILMVLNFVVLSAQQDSIYIDAKISENKREVFVIQEIIYKNTTENPQNQIKLLNWSSAYQNRSTSLSARKLEDRKTDLYFAKPEELGNISNAEIRPRAIIPNDSKLFAQAHIDKSTTHFITSDSESGKTISLLNKEFKANFTFVDINNPVNEVFGTLF